MMRTNTLMTIIYTCRINLQGAAKFEGNGINLIVGNGRDRSLQQIFYITGIVFKSVLLRIL